MTYIKGQVFVTKYAGAGEETVCVYGDPEGLRSLANRLNDLADLQQDSLGKTELPVGEGFHMHLDGLNDGSLALDIGRLDARETQDTKWFTK